jgi:hypothetical protein
MKPGKKAARGSRRRRELDGLVRRMYARYSAGDSFTEIGRRFGGRCNASILNLFQSRGLKTTAKHNRLARALSGLRRRARLDRLALQMHTEYERPLSLKAVGRKYDVHPKVLRDVFLRNGLPVREFKPIPRQPNGSPVRYVPLTRTQLDAVVAKTTRIVIPPELRFEWRHWSLARRGNFIARLRRRLRLAGERPKTPCSANVEPFDYGSRRAHAIVAKQNRGRSSRYWGAMLRLGSQGVIYKGRLYFWNAEGDGTDGGAYYVGSWVPGIGRPALHRVIWEEAQGRAVPAGFVVRFRDGNRNNFTRSNLYLATRNDVARENQAAALARNARAVTALLLDHALRKGKSNDHLASIRRLRR